MNRRLRPRTIASRIGSDGVGPSQARPIVPIWKPPERRLLTARSEQGAWVRLRPPTPPLAGAPSRRGVKQRRQTGFRNTRSEWEHLLDPMDAANAFAVAPPL